MSFFDWFKAGGKTVETLTDGAVNGLDKIWYTKEEQAEDNAQMQALALESRQKLAEYFIDLNKTLGQESSIRSVTRRLIAFLVIIPYVLMVVAAIAVYPWMPEYSKFILGIMDSRFGVLVITIGAFYFGPHMIGRLLGKSKDN